MSKKNENTLLTIEAMALTLYEWGFVPDEKSGPINLRDGWTDSIMNYLSLSKIEDDLVHEIQTIHESNKELC